MRIYWSLKAYLNWRIFNLRSVMPVGDVLTLLRTKTGNAGICKSLEQ